MNEKNNDTAAPQFVRADPILSIAALTHPHRPDHAFLKLHGANSGEHLFALRLGDLDRTVAQLQEMVLRKVKPLADAPGEPEVDWKSDAASEIARQVLSDWRQVDAPLKSLAVSFAIELAKELDLELGRDGTVKLFEFFAAAARHMPLPNAAGDHRFPTEH
jgi:hypothetical protein